MRTFLLICVLFLVITSNNNGQFCADIDKDGQIGISDMYRYINYLATDNPIIDSQSTDNDGHYGITIADLANLEFYMFYKGWLECEYFIPYSYAVSLSDTIFIPYLSSFRGNKTSIMLPVKVSLSDSTKAIYLPLLTTTDNPNKFISFDSLQFPDFDHKKINYGKNVNIGPDTSLIFVTQFFGKLSEIKELCYLHYTVSNPTDGMKINIKTVDRSDFLRFAIYKWPDLYQPVIVYVDYSQTNLK